MYIINFIYTPIYSIISFISSSSLSYGSILNKNFYLSICNFSNYSSYLLLNYSINRKYNVNKNSIYFIVFFAKALYLKI